MARAGVVIEEPRIGEVQHAHASQATQPAP
jgi:hypothetical protein